MKTIDLFRNYGVKFNVLTVVHNITAANITRIYSFYQKNKFQYQQYIACLEPLSKKRGEEEYSLLPEVYGQFLVRLFDLWYQDLLVGTQPYIRQFENYITVLLGEQPEACEGKDKCVVQNIVEADGSVYPCDFYVLEQYSLGNLHNESIEEILNKKRATDFVEESIVSAKECLGCEYYALCRGGCARQRVGSEIHSGEKNYFCIAYKEFFKETLPKMQYIAEVIQKRRNI
jgi:uncharacterized protein